MGAAKADRGVGTWRYRPQDSTYESGPGPRESQRRWVPSGAGAVTFLHDFTGADGSKGHTEFTAAYDDGEQYPVHGSNGLYDTVALYLLGPDEVKQVFQLDGVTTVVATRTVSADGQRLTIDTGGTLPSGKEFRNIIVYECVEAPLVIYGVPNSQPVRAVVWLLLMKRCPFELRAAWPKYGKTAGATASDVDDYTEASVNPRGTIPAMDDDGYILWESHAIMIYLCEKHGWDDLWPADIRARGRVNNYLHFHHRNTR